MCSNVLFSSSVDYEGQLEQSSDGTFIRQSRTFKLDAHACATVMYVIEQGFTTPRGSAIRKRGTGVGKRADPLDCWAKRFCPRHEHSTVITTAALAMDEEV